MTETAMTTAVLDPAEPDGAPRLAVLDILRGIAILGILFMNINDMGGPISASGADPRPLGWTGADQIAWWLRQVLADGTARCLLEMLFGVGMVILTDRAAARLGEWRVLRGYAFRNIVLFLFGLVHIFVLLWPGDILHTYGIAALVAVLFRRLPARALLMIGLVGATAQLGVGGTMIVQGQHRRVEAAALHARLTQGTPLTAADRRELTTLDKRAVERAKGKLDDQREVTAENKARTGSGGEWVRSAWHTMIVLEKTGFELFAVWEAAGTMLIGAALFRWGIVQGRRSRRFYTITMLVAYAVGLSLRAGDAWAITRFDDWPYLVYAAGEYARLATTLGHLALINLLLTFPLGANLLRPFAAAGRTALSIYVAQTLACLWVLYPPWGLRLYERQGWASLMVTAAAVDLALLGLANVWVGRFSIAPVEWAWRSIIVGRRLPFRPGERSPAGGLATA